MQIRRIIIFLVFTINILSMTQFGKAFGDKKDNFFSPSIIKKYDNEYYMADYLSGDLMIYDKDYNLKRIYAANGKLNDLNKIGNELWLSIGDRSYIKVINLSDNNTIEFGQEGMRRGEFSNPGEIEKDDKYIYIADESNNRVQVFDKQKVWVKELSLPKTKISKSSFGLNYSIKKVGINLYVLDKKNKKIYNYENLTLKNTVDLKNFIEPYKLYNVDKKLFVYEKVKNEFVDIKTNKKIKMDVPSDVTLIDIKTFGEAPMGVYFAKNSQLYYFSLIAETSRPLKKVLPVGEGYYVKPIDIKRDISKNVYILDEVLNEILVYSAVGKFIKKIGNLPPNSYSFDIDNNGDFIILSNKTNSIYRLSYNGRKINSLENSYNLLAYEPYYYKDKKKKGIVDNTTYNNKIVIDKSKSLIYITDNKDKKIKVFDASFNKITEFGKKENVLKTVSKKVSSNAFSFNDFDRNSLRDIQINGSTYIIDSPYKRVMIFNNNIFSKNIESEKFSNGLNSISFVGDKIYILDENSYKIYIFNKEMKLEKEINMAQKGYKPIKLSGNLLIATTYVKDFNEKYVILDISSLF